MAKSSRQLHSEAKRIAREQGISYDDAVRQQGRPATVDISKRAAIARIVSGGAAGNKGFEPPRRGFPTSQQKNISSLQRASAPTPRITSLSPQDAAAAGDTSVQNITTSRPTSLSARSIDTSTQGSGLSNLGTIKPSSPIIRDLAVPQIPQEVKDQNFLTGLSGKKMSDLSYDDLVKLTQLTQKQQETAGLKGIQSSFDTQIEQAKKAEEEQAALTTSGKTAEEQALESRIQKAKEDFQAAFAPQFARAQRQGAQEQEAIRRGASFQGSGRGSRAEESVLAAIDRQGQIEAGIAAEQNLQEMALLAQLRGDSADVIEGLNAELAAARTKREGLETEQAKAISELEATNAALGQGSFSDLLKSFEAAQVRGDTKTETERAEAVSNAAIDLDISSSFEGGYARNYKGDILYDKNGKPLKIPVGSTEYELKQIGKNAYGVFNPSTGQVEPISAPGGGDREGGSGTGSLSQYSDILNAITDDEGNIDYDKLGTLPQATRQGVVNLYGQLLGQGSAIQEEPNESVFDALTGSKPYQSVKTAGGSILDTFIDTITGRNITAPKYELNPATGKYEQV